MGERRIGIVGWVGGILEGEERVGEMVKGFADAIRGGEREKDVGATVVGGGRREVKPASAVFRPRLAVFRRVVGDHELPGWVNGVGGEAKGGTMETVPRREGGIRSKGEKMV